MGVGAGVKGGKLFSVIWINIAWLHYIYPEQAMAYPRLLALFWVLAVSVVYLFVAPVDSVDEEQNVPELPEKLFPVDCDALPKDSPSGVYVIKPNSSPPLVVHCEVDKDGNRWTVVQRNSLKTELTWLESWSTFKYGFGNVLQDYWLGNEYIHLLTSQRVYMVRFLLKDKTDQEWYADYDVFSIDKEVNGYSLRLGRYSGTAPDYLTTYDAGNIHDNMKFSTKDKDQDRSSSHCASSYGGWWYDNCQLVHLNAKGYINWKSVCSGDCSHSMIMVKPTENV
ncbi:fibrinogen-like protein 1-like protein [Spea bombifrons]|uniref:fibrinogen-like protein 1-like protein n=1 Tax=Spea bombifrons TaxID=233779 RepID=UPI0023497E10|nr:fibrinogen-like protein 1-like protein [Spea bombifrons]